MNTAQLNKANEMAAKAEKLRSKMHLLQTAKIESVVFRTFDNESCSYTDTVVKGDHLPKAEMKLAAIKKMEALTAEADLQFARFMASPPPTLVQLQQDVATAMAALEAEIEMTLQTEPCND